MLQRTVARRLALTGAAPLRLLSPLGGGGGIAISGPHSDLTPLSSACCHNHRCRGNLITVPPQALQLAYRWSSSSSSGSLRGVKAQKSGGVSQRKIKRGAKKAARAATGGGLSRAGKRRRLEEEQHRRAIKRAAADTKEEAPLARVASPPQRAYASAGAVDRATTPVPPLPSAPPTPFLSKTPQTQQQQQRQKQEKRAGPRPPVASTSFASAAAGAAGVVNPLLQTELTKLRREVVQVRLQLSAALQECEAVKARHERLLERMRDDATDLIVPGGVGSPRHASSSSGDTTTTAAGKPPLAEAPVLFYTSAEELTKALNKADAAAHADVGNLRLAGAALAASHEVLAIELHRLLAIGLRPGERVTGRGDGTASTTSTAAEKDEDGSSSSSASATAYRLRAIDAAAIEAGARQLLRQNVALWQLPSAPLVGTGTAVAESYARGVPNKLMGLVEHLPPS